jgi:hypothetical protein
MTPSGLLGLVSAFFHDRYDPLQLNDGEVKNVNYAYLSVRKKNIILF